MTSKSSVILFLGDMAKTCKVEGGFPAFFLWVLIPVDCGWSFFYLVFTSKSVTWTLKILPHHVGSKFFIPFNITPGEFLVHTLPN